MQNQIPPEKRSALAAELRLIPDRVLNTFKVPAEVIPVLDAVTATLHALLADDDARSWSERLDGCDGYWRAVDPEDVLEAKLDQLAQWFRDLDPEELAQSVASYTARFKNGSAPAFLARLLGSKRYLRLKRAAEKDWALALLGVRRLLRLGLPLAQALEDAFVTLTEEERTDFGRTTPRESAYLELLLQIDAMIDAFLGRRQMDFSGLGFPVRDSEFEVIGIELKDIIRAMQAFLDIDMETYAAELNDMLVRKFRGFEQALANSEDGVGQAATSLIELIDRLLRTAFTKNEVLAWVARYRPDDASLIYEKDGKRLPTKKAEALCFAHVGEAPADDPRIGEMLASSIVRARAATQKIKHADRGTTAEAEELRRLMQSARGAFTYLLRVHWIKGSDRYADLQQRFARAA